MMPDLHKLEHFVELARFGSFAKASTHLRLSQPALSRSIQVLERDLGVQLFVRGPGRATLMPTEAALALLPRAADLVQRARQLAADVLKSESVRPVARIGMAPLLATVLMSQGPAVAKLAALVDVEVITGTPERLLRDLEGGEIDFSVGILPTIAVPATVRTELLGSLVPRVFVRDGHPLAAGPPPRLSDLDRFIRLSSLRWNRNVALHLKDPAEVDALQANVRIDDLRALTRIAVESDAVLFSNFRPVDAALVELRFAEELRVRPNEFFIISRVGGALPPEVLAAQAWVREQYADHAR